MEKRRETVMGLFGEKCRRCGEKATQDPMSIGMWYCDRCAKIGEKRIERDIRPKKD